MAATVHTRRSRLPVLTWIPGYQRAWLSRDAVAGLGLIDIGAFVEFRQLSRIEFWVAGADTVAEPGLLILRLDGPLYTANVHSVITKVLDAVDARPSTDTLIMDNVAMARLTVTVVHQMEEVDRELAER